MKSNPFVQFTVVPNFALGHAVQWKIDHAFDDLEPYNFTVEVSGTPDFSEIHYTLDAKDSFFILDDTNFKQSIYVDVYYRVRLDTSDKNTYYSKTVFFGSQLENRRQYRMATEIVRKELLRLRKFTGVDAHLIKRKAFGKVRKDAVDPISGVPITDNVSDFGTGLDGGYYKPLPILVSYEDGKYSRLLNEAGLGVSDMMDLSLRTIGFPIIESHDVISDTIGDSRFLVKNVTPSVFPGTGIVIIQKLEVSYLPTTDPIYQIKVK